MYPDVLILARSGRQLAAAAVQAGYTPAVIDFFADLDTRETCALTLELKPRADFSFESETLLDCVHGLFATHGRLPIVCGSGFEAQPHLLAALSAFAPLSGCSAAVVSRSKDPASMDVLLRKHGIRSAGYSYVRPPGAHEVLLKRRGACGGDHVRVAASASIPGQREYFQRRCNGTPVSIAFVAHEGGAQVLGVCEALRGDDHGNAEFRYTGAVSSPHHYASAAEEIERIVSALAPAFGLRGLCGVDFILTPDGGWHVLEINPRPTATFDLLAAPGPVFDAHLHAPRAPASRIDPYGDVRASGLCIAKRSFTVPDGLDLPSWCADRPRAGTRISAGMPVCTVYVSRAGSRSETLALLRARIEKVRDWLTDMVDEAP